MIKTVLKFAFTLIIFITLLMFLAYRFIVTGERNEDVYFDAINDFFNLWDIKLKVVEKGV